MGVTYAAMAAKLKVPFCGGGCGMPDQVHEQGLVFLNVLHWRERRFTRRGAKHFLMLIAKAKRLVDPEYLNAEEFDWMYIHNDAVMAQALAGQFGFRIPARLFDIDRMRCARLAQKRGVKLSNYPAVYQWTYDWLDR
jgi:hypothetical protein